VSQQPPSEPSSPLEPGTPTAEGSPRQPWPRIALPVRANGGQADEAPPSERGSRRVALLLACAAVVAAVMTARAAFVASEATGAWQTSVRDEIRRSSLAVLAIDYVFGAEGRIAFHVASEQVRAETARAQASQQPAEIAAQLEAEAEVHDGVVDALLPSSEVASDAKYALEGGGFDLIARLADERAKDPAAVAIDPNATIAAGDAASERAIRLTAITIVVSFAFLFGALAQAIRRRRSLFLALGWTALVTSLVLLVVAELVM
jgi:hypothetical protein